MSKLYSLKNTSVATIENCEDEPIQIPGTIQPHGFIIAVDKKNSIAFCSENIELFLGYKVTDILSRKWSDVLPETFNKVINKYLSLDKKDPNVPLTVSFNNERFDCFFKRSGDYFVLECVNTQEHPYSVYDVLEHTNELVQVVNKNTNLKTLCQLITKKIHEITGYDRVMVYRFDDMYNGEVFAETVVEKHEPFLGLHYPHTDIPRQARELYLRNMMRIIVDVDYTPVPIVTADEKLANPEMLDMSAIHIRSISPIHIEYLKNMGVKATFTISLIKEGKLWGLIACHHYSTKNLSYIKQIQAFLQTQILSSQLAVQETAEKYELSKSLASPLRKLTERLAQNTNFKELHFEQMPEILQVARASGAVLIGRKKIYHNGVTPSDEVILEINKWLIEKDVDEYDTNELAKEFPQAKGLENIASGLLYFKVITSEANVSLMFFRPSLDKVIYWAGEPQTKEGIEKLTPRNSFASWQQLIEGKSAIWEEAEIDTIFQLVYSLQQHLFRVYLREEELRIKQLNDRLVKANKELENINWISTHDLREPLRKIQMFASMLDRPVDKNDIDSIKLSVERIRSAAARMQKLLDDLLSYSKMANTYSNFEETDLNKIIEEVNKSFEDEREKGVYKIDIESLPQIKGSTFQLQQLFINLISNSIKFRSPDRVQNITIKGEYIPNYLKVIYCDTGIGFKPELNEKIFNIFQRGHSRDFHGTGIGLSICKKIMENHGGDITASGEEGKGACFQLFFPIQ